jgi:Flp pilus assembly CpaF family ATPase
VTPPPQSDAPVQRTQIVEPNTQDVDGLDLAEADVHPTSEAAEEAPGATVSTLVQAEVCNQPMADLLSDVLDAGLGVLVTGDDSSTEPVVRALAASLGDEDHLVWLVESEEDQFEGDATTMILGQGEERTATLEALASLEGDRVVTPPLNGVDLLAVLQSTVDGCDGLMMAAAGHSIEAAVTRLASSILAVRPGFDLESSTAWLAAAFPVAIEMGCHRDGTRRIMRIAELSVETPGAALDLWTYGVDDGFSESAPAPAVLDWLIARGYGKSSS